MTSIDYAELLGRTDYSEFAGDPRPGWAGPALLFGAPACDPGSVPADIEIVVAGVPFDGTASSRPGAAEGPFAIRQASLAYSSYLGSLGEHEMCDTRTGEIFRYARRKIGDAGDLHVYPTDPLRTFRAVAAEVRKLASEDRYLVILGGDHSISFPTFAGWSAALQKRIPAVRVGYLQIDNHFDFGKSSIIHGPLYHGSNARRISELPGMAPERMAFVGQAAATRREQLEGLLAQGYHLVTAREIRQAGAQAALSALVKELKRECDAIYVSLDIDVLDCSVAPGTGSVTIGGLTGGELMDTLEVLRALPIQAFDIAEVAPRYDPTGRTAHIAAHLLFEQLFRAGIR